MNKLLLAGAAILLGTAPMAMPAMAQDATGGTNSIEDKAPDTPASMGEMSAEQQAEYDGWPEDMRNVYVGWPAEYQTSYWGWPAESRTAYWEWPSDYQTYYWTLTPDQQNAYWALTDEQRAKIQAMTPDQQAAAWDSIAMQMAGTTAAPAAASGTETVMQSGEVAAAAPPPPAEYPVCSATVTDGCIQPRAAGKNYGNRPLDHWPGKPASAK